jgi:hypothetical protein
MFLGLWKLTNKLTKNYAAIHEVLIEKNQVDLGQNNEHFKLPWTYPLLSSLMYP